MNLVRSFGTVGAAAVLAACSGNLGGGQSTLPNGPPSGGGGTNIQQVAQAAPSATPASASNVATLGQTAAQPLPTIAGYGGSILFAAPTTAPAASPNPKSTPAPVDPANTTSIGITASVVQPSDAPPFDPAATKKHAKHDSAAPSPLLFISLLATADVTFAQYPKLTVDIPRDIASKYRGDTFALALYDPEQKDKSFHLGVVQQDPSVAIGMGPVPSPLPTRAPSPSPTPFGSSGGLNGSLTPPPISSVSGSNQSVLPPQEMTFLAPSLTLTLRENRPVVFALYAVAPSPSPSPTGSPKATPAPAGSGSPAAAAGSPSPVASATGTASPSPTPVSIHSR